MNGTAALRSTCSVQGTVATYAQQGLQRRTDPVSTKTQSSNVNITLDPLILPVLNIKTS